MSSGSEVYDRDKELKKAIEALTGGVSSQRQQGLMFEMDENNGFGSYLKWSENEVSFKEYDELGGARLAGKVEFTKENGTVAFTLTLEGGTNEMIEGWFALAKKDEHYAEVYFPWRLANDPQREFVFRKVLGGFEYLREAEWGVDGSNGFAHNGVGLSGEEEGKVGLVVKGWGKMGRGE